VVGNLESEADRLAVRTQRLDRSSADVVASGETANHTRSGDQRACFATMHLFQRLDREFLGFRFQVERLSTDHAAGAGGAEQLECDVATALVRQTQRAQTVRQNAGRER